MPPKRRSASGTSWPAARRTLIRDPERALSCSVKRVMARPEAEARPVLLCEGLIWSYRWGERGGGGVLPSNSVDVVFHR